MSPFFGRNEVEEITEQEYERYKPTMDQRIQQFTDKETEKTKAKDAVPEIAGSPKGNYQDGANITETYKISSVRPAKGGQQLFFMEDRYGKRVSAFSGLNIGNVGDIVTLSATVQINGNYTNLKNIQIVTDGVDGNEIIAETWWKTFPRRSEHIFDGNYFIAEENI